MRYLAIVQRKRFLGQQELQLLAKELGEYSWCPAQGEVGSDAVSRFSAGTLVIAEINSNNQIQRIEDAADHLVALLQSFSRFSESFKAQAEEIESWKQSLIYQSQELSRREAELLVRAQELEMQLAQVGSLDSEEALAIRLAAEGDPALSPSAIHSSREWLRQREENVETMEIQLTERQRELDLQIERLAAQRSDLQREREALQQQWEQHTATQQNGLTEEQVLQIQAYLQSLYQMGDASEEVALAEERSRWQADWQGYTEATGAIERSAADLEVRLSTWNQARQEWQLRTSVVEAQQLACQEELARLGKQQQFMDALAQAQNTVSPSKPSTTGAEGGESLELLQRQLRDQQRQYQQRASLVLQQEEELHAQEANMVELQERLARSNGHMEADERQELIEELEFEEQGCSMLRETLSQQQQRLALEKEKIDQQIVRLQALVGSFDASPTPDQCLDQACEHLRTSQHALRQRQEQLERDRAELERTGRTLEREHQQLTQGASDLAIRRQENQEHYTQLQRRQIEIERRSGAIEAQRALGQHEVAPGADLEYLLRNLQAR